MIQNRNGILNLLDLVRRIVDPQQMALVTHDAGKRHPLELGNGLSQFQGRFPGAGTDAIQTNIDFDNDPHVHTTLVADRRQRFDLGKVVTGNDRIGNTSQGSDPFPLAFAHDHVGDQDVPHAPQCQGFGFGNLRTGRADGSGRDLHLSDHRGFVTLGMWTPRNIVLFAEVGHETNVRFHSIHVDAQDGRIKRRLWGTNRILRHAKTPNISKRTLIRAV